MSKAKVARTTKAGLIFPVPRTANLLRKRAGKMRVSGLASVALAASLEYFTSEVLMLATEVSQKEKRKRVTPDHVATGIREDAEFNYVFKNCKFAKSGVRRGIHPALIRKKGKGGKRGKKGGK